MRQSNAQEVTLLARMASSEAANAIYGGCCAEVYPSGKSSNHSLSIVNQKYCDYIFYGFIVYLDIIVGKLYQGARLPLVFETPRATPGNAASACRACVRGKLWKIVAARKIGTKVDDATQSD